ncbi:MAG: prepilin-type N-terminal cleavage/methylation domain-containing protein [Acidobacteria bacterium]|nr:prepilin-type N-terminal cleavage/methylation domain-containing protein [Acidobacteriota bacterium]
MSHSERTQKHRREGLPSGFSLIELTITLAIFMVVSGIVMSAMFQMTRTQGTISNRTDMHAAVRSATELLQQEISQAGRVAAPAAISLTAAVTASESGQSLTKSVSSTAGLFVGELLVVGPDASNGPSQEIVRITAIPSANQITAVFQDPHAAGAPIAPLGTFASGVVPPAGNRILRASGSLITGETLTVAQGSSDNVLKIVGDINDDGNILYVEYACNQGMAAAPGTLTRRVVPFNTTLPKTSFPARVLLSNILANPGGYPCFEYELKTVINDTFIINVAVTLTVQTEFRDPQTNQFQTESKSLLNVSPRNVYQAWQLAGGGMADRVQPMPESVFNLLP